MEDWIRRGVFIAAREYSEQIKRALKRNDKNCLNDILRYNWERGRLNMYLMGDC